MDAAHGEERDSEVQAAAASSDAAASPDLAAHGRATSGPSRDALRQLETPSAAIRLLEDDVGLVRMVHPTTRRVTQMHRSQIDRDAWPDFAAFPRASYDAQLRRDAALQWAGRARAEHGSVHQFSSLMHVLCDARVGNELLGALSRLITDEVRHVELCAQMALACDPEAATREPAIFRWPIPTVPWPAPPPAEQRDAQLAWAANAILIACCLGETLSRPMLEAIEIVATDTAAQLTARQILRDEHFHAAFGWDALALILPVLDEDARAQLHTKLSRAFAGFRKSTACGLSPDDVAGTDLAIHPPTVGGPANLGVLTDHQYAMIFYATIEQEIIPALHDLGIDATRAWHEQPR